MGSKGGGGGGKKGGGNPKAPQVKIPQELTQDISNLGQLGTYEATNLNLPYDIGNYYMSLATGGAPGLEAQSPQWAQNALGIIGPGDAPANIYGPGGVFMGESNYTGAGVTGRGAGLVGTTPARTRGGASSGSMIKANEGQIPAPPAGSGYGPDGRVILADGEPYYYRGQQVFAPPGKGNYYTLEQAPVQTGGTTATRRGHPGRGHPGQPGQQPPGTQVGGTTFPYTNNPYLQEFYQMLGQEYNTAQEIPGIQAQTRALSQDISNQIPGTENWMNELYGQIPSQQAFLQQQEAKIPGAEQFLGGQEAFLNQMETGQLMPGQQAEITSQVNSADAAIKQQLANQGIASSTMGAELQGEIGLQGAATAGQLMQGNVQAATGGVNAAAGALGTQFGGVNAADQALATSVGAAQNQAQLVQAFQKLALGSQELQVGEEQALYGQFQNISQQSFDAQKELFNQAMQGYGLEGQFLNQVLAPYGMSIQGINSELQAEIANANNQTNLEMAQMQAQQAQASQMGGLFQGLGSMLGGSNGLMSLFGGGAAAGAGLGASLGATGAAGTVADLVPLVAGLAF